jgi:hypothetical protein
MTKHKLGVSRILECKQEEVKGGWRKMHNEDLQICALLMGHVAHMREG